jgi:hypothetical protein
MHLLFVEYQQETVYTREKYKSRMIAITIVE